MTNHTKPESVAHPDQRCHVKVPPQRSAWPDWQRIEHQCPRRANQMRDHHPVCGNHARMERKLEYMSVPASLPKELWIEGNNGGSFVHITETLVPGMIHLEVGETCVVTVDVGISVAALACILTLAKDEGFQTLLDRYLKTAGGTPLVRLEEDPVVTAARNRR